MVAGVILAAGRSARMGRPKALLTCPDGRTFVRALIDALHGGGVHAPVVVVRGDDGALRREVAAAGAAGVVVNENADRGGQLSSLIAGLDAADGPGVRGVVVVPVDAPLVTSDTIATLIAVFSATGAPIVRARFESRNGHPVVFSRALFDDLRRADPQAGAKAVLRAHASAIVNVDLDDAAVIADIDTPEDYRRLFHPGEGG
jgi:molybdenum cofactor cytidylyltransferase